MDATADDRRYLDEAIDLAREALDDDAGGPFGALVVRRGVVLARARNRVLALRDPTAHAEVLAIRAACVAVGSHALEGAVLYTSCEPCPMCLGAAYWAGLARVVCAVDRHDAARAGFADAFLYEEVTRPAAERRLPIVHLPRAAAQEVLRAWARRADRPTY